MIDGKYEINFTVSGFDRDPLTSLIIEAKKKSFVGKIEANALFNESLENYNRYGRSLLQYPEITNKLDNWNIKY